MPKITLLAQPGVAELVTKRVAQAETTAQKIALRTHKAILRTIKETLNAANLDKKLAKSLVTHLHGALAQHAPDQQQAAE